MKDDGIRKPCRHVLKEGEYGVFVDTGCRQLHLLGEQKIPITAKHNCADCPFWEPKEGMK